MSDAKLNLNDPNPNNETLSQRVLDSLTAEVAVLDQNGFIVAVNKAWRNVSTIVRHLFHAYFVMTLVSGASPRTPGIFSGMTRVFKELFFSMFLLVR